MGLISVCWTVWLRSYDLCEGISSFCNIYSADWLSECKSSMLLCFNKFVTLLYAARWQHSMNIATNGSKSFVSPNN